MPVVWSCYQEQILNTKIHIANMEILNKKQASTLLAVRFDHKYHIYCPSYSQIKHHISTEESLINRSVLYFESADLWAVNRIFAGKQYLHAFF